jgi:hypothetical protein
MTRSTSFRDPDVKAVFDAYPAPVRRPLLVLRELIFAAAAEREDIGEIVETLKWKQPAYLPARPRIGTTIRIDALPGTSPGYAMFFHCQTTLVATFRELYPDEFTYQGNRAIVFSPARPVAGGPLKHCILLALAYHVRSAVRHDKGA